VPKSKIEVMHEAALRVVENYKKTGEPFALFLSSWAFDEARQLVVELMEGRKRDVQVRIGLERQVRIIFSQDQLQTVAVYRQNDEKRIAMPEEWPAFTLTDHEWEARVTELIELADLIIIFWGVTGDGLAQELDLCSTPPTCFKTVAVVPVSPRDIFLHQMHHIFPRIVPLHEIPPFFGLHAEFMPLIERMKTIKALEPEVRSEFTQSDKRLNKFPLPPVSERFQRMFWIEPGY
jgi:hypothetical protein